MRLHPVILTERVTANRSCEFCKGSGVYRNEICFCVTMYYGQPPARRTIEELKEKLKKFILEGKYASRRQS